MKTHLLSPTVIAFAFLSSNASATVHCVDMNSTNPVPPYTDWSTAAANIQDAINSSGVSDTVLVTNGIYQYGGASFAGSNRVYVPSGLGLTIQSLNGPAFTMIVGYQIPGTTNGNNAVRCVYLTDSSTLSGFTLTGGATQNSGNGGGIMSGPGCTVTNCVITGNAAAGSGGGVFSGDLFNCYIIGNVASMGGGVAGEGTLDNCLLTGNTAASGGGAYDTSLINCTLVGNTATVSGGGVDGGWNYNTVIYYNSAPSGPDWYMSKLYYCCTAANATGVVTTNAPAFVDLPGGNFRLQVGSPCINAGTNSFVTNTTDLDGNPRIVGGTVDIGAYENQNTNPVHYVSLTSTNPVAPYTNWMTAATNIQNAVAVAQAGELVVAGAGIYTNGGTVIYGSETNRVALTNGITLLGVYGPSSTIIAGGTQTRCVYVGSNSVVSGFTITNGHASTSGNLTNEQSGGGIWCQPGGVVVNCLVISNFANFPGTYSGGYGGGVYGGTISNCTLMGNIAGSGGGAGGAGALWNCTLMNNVANSGGGARGATLYNCTLSNNSAVYNGNAGTGAGAAQCLAYNCLLTSNATDSSGQGGGGYQGTNFNCLIAGNAANYGGGTYQSTNFNCFIQWNTANYAGGGAYQGALYNCVLDANLATNSISAYGNGAGAYLATLVNCTVTGNSATGVGGGLYGGIAFNSVIYFNSASGGANWTNNPYMYYCCTAPNPFYGTGNITNDPDFVDAAGGDFQLKCGSPCIDEGSTNCFSPIGIIFAPTNDIRGVTRPLDGNGDGIAQFDMGAYEYDPAIDQTPVIRVGFTFASFSTDYAVPFVAEIGGCADYFWWDFGDGTTVTNQSNVSHAWTSPGTYNVVLTAYYSSLGQALSATTAVQVVPQPVYYVNVSNTTPVAPYTNWATAAASIQPAVAAGTTPGRLVLVTDGVYRSSGVIVFGSEYNNLALTNAVVVQSVDGPAATTIWPYQGRCAYVGSNAILNGFTLTGGRTLSSGDTFKEQSGGALWCEPGGTVTNCVLAGNSAYVSGGGAYQGTFYYCTFTNNSIYSSGSTASGGAAYQAVLYNCYLISNKVSTSFPGGKGGGSFGGTLFGCTLVGNLVNNGDANGSGGGAYLGTLYNCVLTGNTGFGYGGGSCSNILWNCTLSGNWADYGGGAYAGTLHNCLVTSNQALLAGGGLYSSTLYNCTVAQNTAANGGGFYVPKLNTVYNSIIYGNTASASGNNWQGSLIGSNNCTFPQLPIAAWGNITNDPMFMDAACHLSAASPCRGAGNSLFATGTDLDGEAWNNPPSMGAYEVYDADFIGALSVAIQASQNSLLVNRSLALTGQITGRAAGLEWSFGDGTIVTNVSYFTSHLWTSPGDFNVVFTAYNADNPGGVSTNLLVHVLPLVPPLLQPASFSMSSTNGFQFQFNGQSNAIYTAQVTTNLDPPVVWQNLQTITSTGGVVQITDANATNATSFYRVGVQ